MVWLVEQAALHGGPGKEFWWVGPVSGQARIVYKRLKLAIPRQLYTPNETLMTLTLLNGAVIACKSADKPDSLYGEDVYAGVVDEASRCKEDSWNAVRSTLTATRGPVRIIGNVKGRKNWFYRLCRRAEQGAKNMHYAKITAYDAVRAGVLDAQEIEDARGTLPEAVFKELYMAEPSDDQGNPFGLRAIRKCIVPALSSDPVDAWGWDLARSHDWTVGVGLNKKGTAAGFERWNQSNYPQLIREDIRPGDTHEEYWAVTIKRICDVTGKTRALMDSTGPGGPIDSAFPKNFTGYVFNSKSKQILMEGLAVAIQQEAVRYPEGPISNELEEFEYQYTAQGVRYSAPEGFYDDSVCALALAVHLQSTKSNYAGWLAAMAKDQAANAA